MVCTRSIVSGGRIHKKNAYQKWDTRRLRNRAGLFPLPIISIRCILIRMEHVFAPLHEIGTERYSVYFPVSRRREA
jgi:hypothetical protein